MLCKAGNNKNGLPDPVPDGATIEKVVEHIRPVGQLIGYYYVCISADFAGIPSTPEDRTMPANVVVRNLLRVWKQVDELAAKLQKTIEDDITHLADSKFLQEIYDSMASW